MGFFGNNDSQSEADELMQEQFNLNQEELNLKKANLYKTRLEVIKGQGGQQWNPDYSSPIPPSRPGIPPGLIPKPFRGRM